MKSKIALLVLVILILAWSAFQPNGILVTLQDSFWSVNLLNKLVSSSSQIDQISLPEVPPHSEILLARQYLKDGQTQFAQEILLPLLHEQDRAVQGTYAEVLFATGQKIEAFGIWEKLNETIVLERAADHSAQIGDSQAFIAAYQTLYRLDPEKYTSSLALAFKSQDRFSEAEEFLLHARVEYPRSEYASDWLRYLADVYVDDGNWQQAEHTYQKTIKENPGDLKTWRNLGLLYSSQLNMPEKAIDSFKKMISLAPGESYGYLLLAQTYEKIGDTGNALDTYQKLLLFSPDDSSALQALERLTDTENSTP